MTVISSDNKGNIGSSSGAAAVFGHGSNETLAGTAGNDIFTATGNNETFVFAANFGKDTITDFNPSGSNHEIISFGSATTFASYAAMLADAAQEGANVVIHDAVGDTLTLANVKLSSLQRADFHFA